MDVSKAVIPAASFGTRFLPVTKAQPKEMMPVLDKPTIQYVVEEAVAAGITDNLLITGRGKQTIERHFDKSYELEEELKRSGKEDRLERVREITDLAEIHYVRQRERAGLGDAVTHARNHVGNNPFALLLGDTIVKNDVQCTRTHVDYAEEYETSVSISDLAEIIIQLTDSTSRVIHVDRPRQDPQLRSPDIEKARSQLQWEPAVGLQDGLNRTIEYIDSML